MEKTIKEAFISVAQNPTHTCGRIQKTNENGLINVLSTWSSLDFTRETKSNYLSNTLFRLTELSQGSIKPIFQTPISCGVDNVIRWEISNNGKFIAMLKEEKKDDNTKKLIEVWSEGFLNFATDVTHIHGSFYGDDMFGTLCWSSDDSKFVYVAEKKEMESEDDDFKKFDWKGDLGEKFSPKASPQIFLFDIPTKSSIPVAVELPIFPGQAQFGQEDEYLIFTGYARLPRAYGLIYCPNRPSGIYTLNLENNQIVHISKGYESCRSPRLTPDKSSVVFLSNSSGRGHYQCSCLVNYNFSTSYGQVIMPVVNEPRSINDFPGLYLLDLPSNPWLESKKGELWILCHSQWRSRRVIVSLEIPRFTRTISVSPHLKVHTPDDVTGSWSLLDIRHDIILAVRSTPSEPQRLVLGKYSFSDQLRISWIDAPIRGENLSDFIEWKIVSFPRTPETLEVILVTPMGMNSPYNIIPPSDKPPLVVYPHGGPHSAFATEMISSVAAYCLLGFSVALVNYTGSIGFGQNSVDALIGKIGELEVDETKYISEALCSYFGYDSSKLVYLGGSHSGFMGAHLTGTFPQLFRACVLRNPVINIGAMVAQTDIPDWCFAENGLVYDFVEPSLITPSIYGQMYEASPIKNVGKVQTPTLVMLGDEDRRVPPFEGMNWVNYLRAYNKNLLVEAKLFSGNGHALDKFEAEFKGFQIIVDFFYRNLFS